LDKDKVIRMNIIETKNRIADWWNGVERDPGIIAAFPAHTEMCTKIGPLKIRHLADNSMPPAIGAAPFIKTIGMELTCLECGGQTKKEII